MNIGIFLKYFKKAAMILAVKFKPLTVHTEAIFYDDVWKIVKEKIKKKEIHTWYLMTPVNFPLTRGYFSLKESSDIVEKKMKKRYIEMRKLGERLQLHVHLHPLMKIDFDTQEKLIKRSLDWLQKEVNIFPKEIVFGWWRYNEDSKEIAKKYGLKIIEFMDYNSIHDFDWVINCKGESSLH